MKPGRITGDDTYLNARVVRDDFENPVKNNVHSGYAVVKHLFAIRDARTELSQTFQTYMDVSRAEPPDPKALAAAVGRLAALCETLVWRREAEAWARLAPAD